MAAAVPTSYILTETETSYIILLTGSISDTQEVAVKKVDADTLTCVVPGQTPKPTIRKVKWNCTGSGLVTVLFDASSDTTALQLCGSGEMDFGSGIRNLAGSGVTGDILFTTSGFSNGGYQIILECTKEGGYSQAPIMSTLTETDALSGVFVTGNELLLTAAFTQPVEITTGNAHLTIALASGSIKAQVKSGNKTKSLVFSYTFTADDTAETADFVIGALSGIVSVWGSERVPVNVATLNTAAWTVNPVEEEE